METSYRMTRKQQLRADFCSGRIPFSEYVRELGVLCNSSRKHTKYKVIDVRRAKELCIEVFGDSVKVGWHILPNPLDEDRTLQWLIDRNIIELDSQYNP